MGDAMSDTANDRGGARKSEPRVGLFVTCLVDIIRPTGRCASRWRGTLKFCLRTS